MWTKFFGNQRVEKIADIKRLIYQFTFVFRCGSIPITNSSLSLSFLPIGPHISTPSFFRSVTPTSRSSCTYFRTLNHRVLSALLAMEPV